MPVNKEFRKREKRNTVLGRETKVADRSGQDPVRGTRTISFFLSEESRALVKARNVHGQVGIVSVRKTCQWNGFSELPEMTLAAA